MFLNLIINLESTRFLKYIGPFWMIRSKRFKISSLFEGCKIPKH